MKIRVSELRRLIREAMVGDLADDMYVEIDVVVVVQFRSLCGKPGSLRHILQV